MKFTAEQIAGMTGGVIDGNPNAEVYTVSRIEEGKEGSISFLSNPKYTEYVYSTEASVVIISKDFIPSKPINTTLVKVDDPYVTFSKLLEVYQQMKDNKEGVSSSAVISDSAKIGEGAYIGANAVIEDNVIIGKGVKIYPMTYVGENTTIGNDTTIFSGVKIYDQVEIGNKVRIHSNAVIGGDGFGFAPKGSQYDKVPQIGNVIIEDDVEIGSNTTIDRATLGSTIIREGVKLDNLIQIAHNVEIGKNTVIAAQVGVSGSTKIGQNCMIGGQAGIIGHLKIGNNVKIAGQSGVTKNLKDGAIVQGAPAFDVSDYTRSYVGFRKLPVLMNKIQQLEKIILKNNK